ncbi:MAG: DNA-3-methyladenine glycosylase I [Promethearchaeota archaeon]|nr:MAG: DNA-3-methyladenine glycosylase I [Candidatus Lokiarchaeota archaeon]
MVKRCEWAEYNKEMKEYHDNEWGTPEHDDRKLFENIVLQGSQAGLSWNTILQKRVNYRKVFKNFDYEKVVEYDEEKIEELLQNDGIVRNRLKIESAISNAKTFLKIRKEFGTFNKYIWQFVDFKPIHNSWESLEQIPGKTELSVKISKDMKKRGFKFVGPTIVYALMQSIGMVNDHLSYCFRYQELKNKY